MDLESLARQVVDSGFKVHRALGPGLLETAYEHCLCRELELRSLAHRRQVLLPVTYEDVRLDAGYRIDVEVESLIILEIKSVEMMTRLHEAQVLTYLRLSGLHLGFMMNFNVTRFKDGLRRFIL